MSSTVPSCNVSNTAALLRFSLDSQTQTKRRVPPIFFQENVLKHPTFVFIVEIVNFVSSEFHFHWDELLCLKTIDCTSKKDKIEFLTKLLAIVSRVIGIRLDIFLSPPTLLRRDASSVQTLLQAIATVSMASAAVIAKAVTAVASIDSKKLYNIGVETRESFISFQALVRGWLARSSSSKYSRASVKEEAINNGSSMQNQIKIMQLRIDHAQQEYEECILRQATVAEDIIKLEERLKKENEKLVRILRLQSNSGTSIANSNLQQRHPRPRSAPDMNRVYSVVNEQFADCISDLKATQMRLKHKEQIMMERQRKLKERAQSTKIKETGLKLQEEKVAELANKIRRQQGQLQAKKMEFERARAMPLHLIDEGACKDQTYERNDLKEAKQKLRQRTRMLNAREAHIIRMAKELRRREEELSKREAKISESMINGEIDVRSSTRYDHTGGTSRDIEQCAMDAIEEVDEEEEVQPARVKSSIEKRENVSLPNPINSSRVTELSAFECNPPQLEEQLAVKKESKSRLERTKPTISTQRPSNHDFSFTFEKDTDIICDGHCHDAQLQCAMNNLRELL